MERCQITEIVEDVKSISKDINEIKVTLGVNTQSLEYHIKRTDLLEEDLKCSKRFQYMIIGGITVISVVVPLLAPLVIK